MSELTPEELEKEMELEQEFATAQVKPKRGRPPGGVGTVNRDIDYRCAVCNQEFTPEKLFKKIVTFRTLTDNKHVKARTVAWVCESDMTADPAYKQEAYVNAPALRPFTGLP